MSFFVNFLNTIFQIVFKYLIMYQCDPYSPNIEIKLKIYKRWNNKYIHKF